MREWKDYRNHIIKQRRENGKEPPPDDWRWDIKYTQAVKYIDRWDILP
jgi:hypothetical protein